MSGVALRNYFDMEDAVLEEWKRVVTDVMNRDDWAQCLFVLQEMREAARSGIREVHVDALRPVTAGWLHTQGFRVRGKTVYLQ